MHYCNVNDRQWGQQRKMMIGMVKEYVGKRERNHGTQGMKKRKKGVRDEDSKQLSKCYVPKLDDISFLSNR
jgi:hypothetical protein